MLISFFVADNKDYKQEKVCRIQLQAVIPAVWHDSLSVWYTT